MYNDSYEYMSAKKKWVENKFTNAQGSMKRGQRGSKPSLT